MTIEIVNFPIKNMGFPIVTLVYQRVSIDLSETNNKGLINYP